MCSFRIQGNICGAWPSLDADEVEVAVDSCFCCVRGAGLFDLWLLSSVSEETLASSISVKCVLLLLRLLAVVEALWSEGGEELLDPRLSLLVQGRGSAEASEQLDGCRNRVSGVGDWKPRELSPTAPKWPVLVERLTLRSIPL